MEVDTALFEEEDFHKIKRKWIFRFPKLWNHNQSRMFTPGVLFLPGAERFNHGNCHHRDSGSGTKTAVTATPQDQRNTSATARDPPTSATTRDQSTSTAGQSTGADQRDKPTLQNCGAPWDVGDEIRCVNNTATGEYRCDTAPAPDSDSVPLPRVDMVVKDAKNYDETDSSWDTPDVLRQKWNSWTDLKW